MKSGNINLSFYLKAAYSGLNKEKLNSIVAIVGLAVAFTCSLFAISLFQYELSYNQFYEHSERIYQLNTYFKEDKMVWDQTPLALSAEMAKFPEVEAVTALETKTLDLTIEGSKPVSVKTVGCDNHFFTLFPQTFLFREINSLSPTDIILTDNFALKNWGTTEVTGNTIGGYTIKGVVKAPPANTTLPFDALLLLTDTEVYKNDWVNYNYSTFIRLTENTNGNSFAKKLNAITLDPRENGSNKYFDIVPLNLVKNMITGKSFTQAFRTYIIVIFALSLLSLSALFNFIMLTTARYLSKLKMYATHKTMGASNRQIMKMLYSEIFLSLLVVFFISAVCVELYYRYVFSFMAIPLSLFSLSGLFVKYVLACTALVFMAGLYPVIYIRSLTLKTMLVGGSKKGNKGQLDTWMIGVQLTVAILFLYFITGTANQFYFMTKGDLGFKTDNIGRLKIKSEAIRKNIEPFINDLKSDKVIVDAIWSDYDVFRNEGSYSSKNANEFLMLPDYDENDKRLIFFYPVKKELFQFFEFTLNEGNFFDKDNEVVVNQQLVNEFKVKDIVGQIKQFNNYPIKVSGIISDFQHNPVTEPNRSAVFINSSTIGKQCWGGVDQPSICYFKYSPEQQQKAFSTVREIYAKHSNEYIPDIMTFTDYIETHYQEEKRMLVIFSIITIISIFISLIGLFALISFKLHSRRKEIALRKIQGASTVQIMSILLKEYFLLLIISFLVASPIAQWGLNHWLSQYQLQEKMNGFLIMGILLFVAIIVFATVISQVIKTSRTNPVEVIKENS